MIHNIILRVFAVIATSLLINITLIDGFISNLVQIDFKQFSLTKNLRHKTQVIACLGLVCSVSYLLVLLCFKNFLNMSFKEYGNETDDEEEEDNEPSVTKLHIGRLIFLDIVPIIILAILVMFFIFLVLSYRVYTPPKSLYHIEPSKQKGIIRANLKNTVKSMFRLKKRFFRRLRKKIKEKVSGLPIIRDIPGMNEKRVEYLSWHILKLESNQKYELNFRYFKFLAVTLFTLFIYVMFFVRLNVCTCCS